MERPKRINNSTGTASAAASATASAATSGTASTTTSDTTSATASGTTATSTGGFFPVGKPGKYWDAKNAGTYLTGSYSIPQSSQTCTRQDVTETSFSTADTSGKSAQEKKNVRNKIVKDYTLPDAILDAALEAADYNEGRTRQLLQTMGYNKKGESATSSGAGTSGARASRDLESSQDTETRESRARQLEDVTAPDFSTQYKSTTTPAAEPVIAEEEPASISSTPDSSVRATTPAASTSSTAVGSSVRATTPAAAVSKSDVRIDVSSSLSGHIKGSGSGLGGTESHLSSADNSRLGNLIGETGTRKREPMSSQSTAKILLARSQVASKDGIGLAKGPDFALWNGPSSSLLQKEMFPLRGPDPSLRHGPRKENLSGAKIKVPKKCSLAAGANRSLRTGPNKALLLANSNLTYL
eukprot:gene16904-18610_t